MNARLIKAWNDLQSSYYFIPGLMAIGAIILAAITGHLDQRYDYAMAEKLGWFYSNKADGARAILTTIAGSMMTVASVTFSITMVAVTSAAGQYGPRLIGNFMRDRGNQITLGTFTSTFVYCLLILRSARTGDGGTGDNAVAEFVPNISLLVAMGLTLTSVAVMIYFIHHIPETLNVGNITGRVGRKLRRDVEVLFPHDMGKGVPVDDAPSEESIFDDLKAEDVCTRAEGYIQAVNEDALLEYACKNDLIIKFNSRPGEFVVKGDALLNVYCVSGEELSEEQHDKIRSAFAMGQERTDYQNVLFLSDQLAEILARALSPGINDPFTAINCLHWFQSAISAAMSGHTPSPYRLDKKGNIRAIVYPVSFEDFVDSICGKIRPYVCTDVNVTRAMIDMLSKLRARSRSESQKAILDKHLERIRAAANESLRTEVEKDALRSV